MKCVYCNRDNEDNVKRCRCGLSTIQKQQADAQPEQQLGDWTEQQLKKIGVTQERYKAAKELFGLAPTCGCNDRKRWLNSVSDWWQAKMQGES